MSYPLLTEPDKLHDIADDLESIFWVLVFSAMKCYSLPDQDVSLHGFDDQSLDAYERRVGGTHKRHWLFSDQLSKIHFVPNSLHDLIQDSQLCWFQFYIARHGTAGFDSVPAAKAELLRMLDRASSPSFWAEKYAASLSATRPQ